MTMLLFVRNMVVGLFSGTSQGACSGRADARPSCRALNSPARRGFRSPYGTAPRLSAGGFSAAGLSAERARAADPGARAAVVEVRRREGTGYPRTVRSLGYALL